jgi:hypothetical protein
MAEYYALQAALCFSIAHIFVRRGLVHSNAFTGSVISLGTSATILWLLALIMVPLSDLRSPAIGYFIAAGFLPRRSDKPSGISVWNALGLRGHHRSSTHLRCFLPSSRFYSWARWLARNIIGTCLVTLGVFILSSSKPTGGHWNKKDIVYPVLAALAFGISIMLRKTGLMTELRGHRKDRRCPVGSDR